MLTLFPNTHSDPIDNYYSLDQPSVCEKHSVPYTSIAQDSIEACSACPNSCVTGTPASSEVLFCYMQHDDPEERAEAVHDEESPNPSSTPQSPSTESILATKGIATRNGANLSTPAILDSPIPQAALTSGTAGNASENALPKPPSSVTNSKRDVGAEIYSKASPDHGCCCGKVPAFRILVGLGIYLPPEAAAIKTALWGSHGSPWAAAAEETITVVSDLPESFYCAHPELPAETVDEVLAEYVDSQLVDLPAAKLG